MSENSSSSSTGSGFTQKPIEGRPKPEATSDARELAEKIKDTVSKAIAKDDISEHDIDEAVALIEAHDAKIRAELKKVPMAMLKDCRRMTFNYDADSSDREDRLTLIAARYGYVDGSNERNK